MLGRYMGTGMVESVAPLLMCGSTWAGLRLWHVQAPLAPHTGARSSFLPPRQPTIMGSWGSAYPSWARTRPRHRWSLCLARSTHIYS